MSTKITIFDIDLGFSVDEIISEAMAELSAKTQEDIGNAIATAKLTELTKRNRDNAQRDFDEKVQTNLTAAYTNLLAAGENGLPVSTVMAMVTPSIATPSSFMLRMKAYLVNHGNAHNIDRKKVHGTAHYVIIPTSNNASNEPAD